MAAARREIAGLPPVRVASAISQTTSAHVFGVFGHNEMCGLAPGGVPSTVVDCTLTPPQVLRPGPITAAQIVAALG